MSEKSDVYSGGLPADRNRYVHQRQGGKPQSVHTVRGIPRSKTLDVFEFFFSYAMGILL